MQNEEDEEEYSRQWELLNHQDTTGVNQKQESQTKWAESRSLQADRECPCPASREHGHSQSTEPPLWWCSKVDDQELQGVLVLLGAVRTSETPVCGPEEEVPGLLVPEDSEHRAGLQTKGDRANEPPAQVSETSGGQVPERGRGDEREEQRTRNNDRESETEHH